MDTIAFRWNRPLKDRYYYVYYSERNILILYYESHISPTPSARNLGVIFDEDFSFVRHINSIVKSSHYHMREFRWILKHLDWDTAIYVANAIVGSRIDYCNSLLYGVHKKDILRLQRGQNTLARIVTRSLKYTSSEELRKKLHWLPFWSRICFKINLITYKAINSHQPQSLWKRLKIRDVPHNLRSARATTLTIPFAKCFGDRAYSYHAPRLWNILAFHKALKTHYNYSPVQKSLSSHATFQGLSWASDYVFLGSCRFWVVFFKIKAL